MPINLTQISVALAAELRNQVRSPDEWDLRPMKMGAPDDDEAPTVLLLQMTRPIGDRRFRCRSIVNPHLVTDSAVGARGTVEFLLMGWQQALLNAWSD